MQAGDILVSTVRPNLNAVAIVPEELDGATASTGFSVLRTENDRLSSEYLFHWVRSRDFIDAMMQRATGQSYPAVSDKIVKSSEIPLPTLVEQRRIAAILDQADALRRLRRRALDRVNTLSQAVFDEMFGDPVANNLCFRRVPLHELVPQIDSGWSPKCLDRPSDGNEWGVLKLSAVTSGRFIPSENKALPNGETPRTQHSLKKGDILFTRKNTKYLVAATVVISEDYHHILLPDLIFRLRVSDKEVIDPVYLQALLAYPSKRRSIQKLSGGSAGSMPNISKTKLREVLIELPRIEQQIEFRDRLAATREIETSFVRDSGAMGDLFQALQHRAFRGEL